MNRNMIAALAALLVIGGILAVVTASSMRRHATEQAVVKKTWEVPDDSWKKETLLTQYQLTDRNGKVISSESFAGKVQVASFFFASCPNTCFAQNKAIETLQEQFKGQPVKFLSISCNPEMDTPDAMREYGKKFNAPADQWHFLTGDLDLTRRIGAEIFQVHVDRMVHLDRLIVLDKWGKIRGSFHWKEADKLADCKALIQKLVDEKEPPPPEAETTKTAPVDVSEKAESRQEKKAE